MVNHNFERMFRIIRSCVLFILLLLPGGILHAQIPKVQAPSKRSVADLQALPDDTMKVLYFNRVGWDTAFYNLSLGIEYAQEGLKVAKRIDYTLGKIICLNTLGATYNDMGEFDEAIAAHTEGLKYAEEYGDSRRTGTALMNMSLVYSSMGDTVSARNTLQKAVDEYEKADYKKGLSVAYINLGSLYMRTGFSDEAKHYFSLARDLGVEMGLAEVESHAWSALGVVYSRTGLTDSADYCMERAWAMIDTMDNEYLYAQVMSNQIGIYLERKQYDKALVSMRECLNIFSRIGVREEVVDLYSNMSELFREQQHYDSALLYWKKYMSLRDSIVNEDVLNHQNNITAKFENDKQKQQIELLAQKADTRQWFLGAIIIAFVMLVFLVTMLFMRNRFRKKTNLETARQSQEIEEQNVNITDSINYASRIQNAVVPSPEQLTRHFKDAFVLSRPKDIVSGDFWWCSELDGKFYLAGADSTGHGVPGGFMSMLGSVFLFELITERKVSTPSEILNQLREKVISALSRGGTQNSGLKDGMDIVICTFSADQKKLEFACAMNPLWVIRKNSIIEYRADKFPVGEYHGDTQSFSLQEHACEAGDMIYIFSDGYADQFGGPNGKKLKYKQLRDILCQIAELSCKEQQRILNDKFLEWMGSHEQVDDVLVIGIRI